MVKHGRFTVLSLFLFFLLGFTSTQAQSVLHVNRTDPTCGGQSPCFSTVQAAINAAGAGNVIQIQAGSYPEQLSITGKNNFAGAAEVDRIIIEADPATNPGQVVLTGAPGTCTGNYAIRLQQSKFITIRGLTITGTGGQAITLLGGNNQNQDIHIELNRIFANGSSSCNGGITVARGNPGTLIVNNLIYANGRNGISFIDAEGGPHYIINNTIYGNQWNGIDVARNHTITLASNIINNNGSAPASTGGRYGVRRESFTTPQPAGIKLLNNLVCGNTQGEISTQVLDATDSSNFTPVGNEGAGVGALAGCDVAANLFGNVNGADNQPNTADDDFSLKPNSLAIDVGMDPRTLGFNPSYNPIFEADFVIEGIRPADGNADGVSAFDAGAFEFVGDVIAPQVVIVSPSAGAYVRGTVTVSAQASDNVAITTITLSAGGQSLPASISPALPALSATATGLWNTTAVSDGNSTIAASAADSSSITGSVSRSVIVDNTPPDTQITDGPEGQIAQTTTTFTFNGTDNLTPTSNLVFAWRIDAGAWSSFSSNTSLTVDNLGGGSHTFEVIARDLAGNEDPTPASRTFTVQVGPSITNVDPASGIIGTLVTITGSDFEPGTTQITFNGVAAVIRTITATEITTTVPPTATTGLLTVTTSRGSASRNFTVPTSQDFTLVISPSSIPTVQGGSAGVLIDAIPVNGFSGLIQLVTGSLPTGVVATFAPSTLAPNNHALLTLTTTLNTPAGAHVIELRGSSPIDGQTITRTGTVTLNVAAPGQTMLVGQVLDGDDRPLANVSIKLGGATLTHLGSSDAAGNLFIPLSVTGPTVFLIDGSPANNATTNYPTIPITLNIQPGVINELGYVPRMRGQPVARLIPFVPGQATVITDGDLPGFKMTIPAGVQIIGWDGQPNNQFGVTTVPIDRSPLPPLVLPTGLEARQIYLFSFGKVGGGLPTGNIPIDTPNNVGALPGEKADLYYFNEAPDGSAPNQWEKYGTATVSLDGTTLVTDINPATGLQYGIPRFCCGALAPVFDFLNRIFGASGGPNDGGKKAGDPVDVSTGFFYVDKTDMVLPSRLPVVITRTHRTNMSNSGPFGIGTSASFGISLVSPAIFSNQTITLISPGNKQDNFSRQPNGTYINTTSPSLRGAVLIVAGPSDPVFTLRFKDGMVWGFDSFGVLIRQSDRNGNTITYTRDNFSRVVNIQEPAGRSIAIAYDGLPGQGFPNIRSITDPIGRQIRYTYDAAGRLETVTDPAGGVTRYSYDSANRMLTLTDPRNITFLTNEYDANGRVSRQTQADGGVWTFAYTTNSNYISQTVVTNPRGHATTYRFNAAGYQSSEMDALGHTTTLERQTGTNLVLSSTDPLRRITRFEYDGAGNATRIIDPAGNSRTFGYEPAFNRLANITDPLGNNTRFEYDNFGNLVVIVNPLGHRTTFTYNVSGQPISTTDSLGNVTTFTRDPMGNVASVVDPLNNILRRTYDLSSRLSTQMDPRGKKTIFAYDALNRIISITDPAGGVTQFSYDLNGNLLTVRDARGNSVEHSYDGMDRLVSRTDPLGAIETLQYDEIGNVIHYTDRNGQTSIFAYDSLNRRTTGTYSDGTSNNYIYDSVDRLVRVTDTIGSSVANQFDSLNRLVTQVTNLGRVNYLYDALGRRTRLDIPGQSSIFYVHDSASRLSQVVQGSQVVNFSYDSSGRRTRLTLPNGVSTEYQYDAASRLTGIIYRNALGILGDLTYQYDRASNRTGVGGSFARTLLPGPVSAANYDAANRQLQFSDKKMIFDANGNLSSVTNLSGKTVFNWDARNQLRGITGDGISAEFTYDVIGRRSESTLNDQRVRYQYDGLNPIQEASSTGISANILSGMGIDEYFVRAQAPSGAQSHFLTDALGSSVALTDDFGVVQNEYSYEPFGKTIVSGTLSSNPFQYTGRESDDTGLHYYRARYYNSETQRFISEDPLGFAAGDSNLFVYAKNNPTNFRDPTGQFVPAAVVAGGLCAVGAVIGASTYQQLAGKKPSFAGLLGSAAAGCVGGLGLGWGVGIAVETAVPSIMVGGGQVTVWGGLGTVGPQLATTKAAEIGATTLYQTFTGSTLTLLESAGLGALTASFWPSFSGNFVSGAGSATVLIGRGLSGASVLLTRELPVLLQNQAVLNHIFYP